MRSNDKLKETDLKNCTYYYFHDIISINDLDVDNILIDEKSYKKFSIYIVAYKTPHGGKPLYIIFEKIDRCIREYDKTRYLSFFHSDKKHGNFFSRIRHLIMLKSNISYTTSYKYEKIEIDSDDG